MTHHALQKIRERLPDLPAGATMSIINRLVRSGDLKPFVTTVSGKSVYRVEIEGRAMFPVVGRDRNVVTVLMPGHWVEAPTGRVTLTKESGLVVAPQPPLNPLLLAPPAPPRKPTHSEAIKAGLAAMSPEKKALRDQRMSESLKASEAVRASIKKAREVQLAKWRALPPEERSRIMRDRAVKAEATRKANRERKAAMIAENEAARTGFPQATITCEDCRTETFTAAAERGDQGHAQVRRKAGAKGWTYVKGVDRCPACEAARKAKPAAQETPVPTPKEEALVPAAQTSVVTDIRQPTPANKRAIIARLEEVYDHDAQRYKAAHTDVTVAEDLGQGIMFGWVAVIREDLFGPAGNAESDALVGDFIALLERQDAIDKKAADLHTTLQECLSALREMNVEREKIAADLKTARLRIEALKATLGPRAARI